MSRLWFVTPAWQRFEIVEICLEQRRRVIEYLAGQGIEAHQVVIADDENLDIARSLGVHTIEMDNSLLGRRWNAGTQMAAREGAEWMVQIGSDSWIAPEYFVPLTRPRITLTSEAYCAVTADVLAELWVSPNNLAHSAGPYVFHRGLLAPSRFAPCAEDSRMTDTSTIRGITRSSGRPIRWETRTVHPFQYVGFRVEPMMTRFENLWRRWGVAEHDPWPTLAAHYPADLVERARLALTRERSAA